MTAKSKQKYQIIHPNLVEFEFEEIIEADDPRFEEHGIGLSTMLEFGQAKRYTEKKVDKGE